MTEKKQRSKEIRMQRENLKFKIENLKFAGSLSVFTKASSDRSARFSKWVSIFGFLVLFISGCAEQQKRSCPPMRTKEEISQVLKGYLTGPQPLRASGNCKISYTNDKGETFAQGFPVRIWYLNNNKYCLYGDVMFDAKGMSFAVNDGRFWVYAKQFGVYTTGEIDAAGDDYLYGPAVFLDFLQPFSAGCRKVYMAEAEEEFDVLMCRDDEICGTKKILMDRCNRKVRKIEYLNCSGNLVLEVEADEYKNVKGVKGLLFPRKLSYKYFKGGQCTDQREIKLDSVQLWNAEAKQVNALFTPPDVNNSNNKAE
ncbi:MAG: hypothetical protein PHQ00_04150 [Phycisphaerae bacterium]|nr:hypothetical protein [Phycisphaerae bacterium]